MAKKKAQRAPVEAGKGKNAAVEAILERIRETRHFDFRNYKRATLHRRIERRMAERRCRTIAEYQALLEEKPAEFDALIGAMLIKVTSFFRDPDLWKEIRSRVLPRLLSEKRPGEEVRIWCAGCATGEEAFSAAILLAEAMGPSFSNEAVKVFGTDVDEKAIATARRGFYGEAHVADVPKHLLERYFVEQGNGFCIRKDVRRSVVFGVNNLVSDAPISRLDMVLCRNVFIYLDSALQNRVLTRFHYALRRHGILVLGKSELIPFAGKIFEPLDLPRRLYRKDGRREVVVAQERLVSLLDHETLSRPQEASQGETETVEQFHRDVLHSMPQPLITTSLDGTVLFWNRAAATLWGRAESEVTGKKLAAINLPGLAGDLLIEKTNAVREGRSERERGSGTLTRGGDAASAQLTVDVSALRDGRSEMTGLLYVVEDVTSFRELEGNLRRANDERQANLEELQTLNEEMQSSNEEMETTNEELQSANEELQTTNEELQSSNEELETTNEELQSTNAELDATNRELARRTEEMNTLTFVQRTIIRSLSAAVIVLEDSGRVKLWNLAAERLLGITEEEAVGQSFWTLQIPALGKGTVQRIRKSLQQNASLRAEQVEYELPGGAQGTASVAAVPIIDSGKVLGSVILFDDATRLAVLGAELAKLKAGSNGKSRRP
jgi:two-component system, chemotaxis family, CheB/CheR fusion protein